MQQAVNMSCPQWAVGERATMANFGMDTVMVSWIMIFSISCSQIEHGTFDDIDATLRTNPAY